VFRDHTFNTPLVNPSLPNSYTPLDVLGKIWVISINTSAYDRDLDLGVSIAVYIN